MKVEGEKPRQTGRFKRELIGAPDCPILVRWTLLEALGCKLLLHHFTPNADDRDQHDHPRSFLTLVLRGGYVDHAEVPCPACQGHSRRRNGSMCPTCDGFESLPKRDRLRAGSVRFRSAAHRHRTRVEPSGCWTLVVMGPLRRPWGFWRDGRWWEWREYERHFGFGMRCPDE